MIETLFVKQKGVPVSHRHSIFCILPPHMLDQIVQNGSSAQSDLAAQTLAASRAIREKRQSLALTTTRIPLQDRAAVAAVKQRAVYTANTGTTLPGTLVRSEGNAPVSDVAVNEAYDGSGDTFDLYDNIFGRNSIDGNGLKLISTVHYSKNYDNAFWDGEQMVYGDGDENLPVSQRLFNRFTICLDVIGHELTHGVTQYEANLTYANQPGALNEAVSDIFGSLVKQYKLEQTATQADWIIGEGLFTSNVNEGPWHRLRRSRAGQRPAAREYERLCQHQSRQRWCAYQLWYRQPRLLFDGG
jgi:Zn-dependent metalloprotease